ncbi:MAG: hypothetical protein JXR52_02320 [Bacteroidales bacterium]|nr:hypothetical protein [Bacteroidales bacterium]MBN2697636.1 hypothetical protein [Bacteroidales bacterium]
MKRSLSILVVVTIMVINLSGQEELVITPGEETGVTAGWADEAVSTGYITAPSVMGLMFISALVSEWNAGYFGIPATAMIAVVPPLIYAGGRSASISPDLHRTRAQLGWMLYALSIVPAAFALYGFTTDLGATLPVTVASGVLGTAGIVAMSSYAFARAETARELIRAPESPMQFGVGPLIGGAAIYFSYEF